MAFKAKHTEKINISELSTCIYTNNLEVDKQWYSKMTWKNQMSIYYLNYSTSRDFIRNWQTPAAVFQVITAYFLHFM